MIKYLTLHFFLFVFFLSSYSNIFAENISYDFIENNQNSCVQKLTDMKVNVKKEYIDPFSIIHYPLTLGLIAGGAEFTYALITGTSFGLSAPFWIYVFGATVVGTTFYNGYKSLSKRIRIKRINHLLTLIEEGDKYLTKNINGKNLIKLQKKLQRKGINKTIRQIATDIHVANLDLSLCSFKNLKSKTIFKHLAAMKNK